MFVCVGSRKLRAREYVGPNEGPQNEATAYAIQRSNTEDGQVTTTSENIRKRNSVP